MYAVKTKKDRENPPGRIKAGFDKTEKGNHDTLRSGKKGNRRKVEKERLRDGKERERQGEQTGHDDTRRADDIGMKTEDYYPPRPPGGIPQRMFIGRMEGIPVRIEVWIVFMILPLAGVQAKKDVAYRLPCPMAFN